MTDAELAFKTGKLFNSMITDAFWDSFKGELGRTQVEMLVYLYDHEQAQASEIAEGLNISKQHVSKNIAKFIDLGFVKNSQNRSDRRSQILSLSDDGKEYMKKHIEVSNNVYIQLLGEMSSEEKADFRNSMEMISDLLTKYSAKRKIQA